MFSSFFCGLFTKKHDILIATSPQFFTLISGYLILPLIISIPYYFGLNYLSFVDSYFEAVSGFTSTGFSIFENIKHVD